MIAGKPLNLEPVPIKNSQRFTVDVDEAEDGRFSAFIIANGDENGYGVSLGDKAGTIDFIRDVISRQV
jgi:hypothetical protein